MEPHDAGQIVYRLASAVRAATLYSPGHPLVEKAAEAFIDECRAMLARSGTIRIGLVGREIVMDEGTVALGGPLLDPFVSQLQGRNIERMTIARGVTVSDLKGLIETLAGSSTGPDVTTELATRGVRNVSVGTIAIGDAGKHEMAADVARRIFAAATEDARRMWDTAAGGRTPETDAARSIVSNLSRLAEQDRSRMVALAAIRKHDDYTFTHMVNVAALTMSMARSLGLDEQLVADFGLAGLMHDIGKVRTPLDILKKPGTLTQMEYDIVKRHVVDGAMILGHMPNLPAIVRLAAFEHHLRLDLTGYPENVTPRTLNLCTMVVSIADVFDALRSFRPYRDSLASERVRALLVRDQRRAFHPALLHRFVTMVGIFPLGHLVRLGTNEIAVVTAQRPDDPLHPQVKVIIGKTGAWLAQPELVNTWEKTPDGRYDTEVVEAMEPDAVGVDGIDLL